MKILMVNKFLYPRGGAESYVLKIGAFLQGQGHEVEYFGMYDSRNTVGNSLGLYTGNKDFHQAGMKRFFYPFSILYSIDARRKISAVIKQFRPDVVHFNNINFQITPSVIDAVYAAGIPAVQTVHDLQMLCPNHLMLDIHSLRPCELCLNGSVWHCAGKSCIHGSRIKSILGAAEGWLYRHKKTYDRIDTFICPSRFIEEMLLKKERYRGKTVLLRNFIEEPDPGPDSPEGDYVLYFGRLSEEKGIDGLLEACRMLPDIPFVIAGSGPMEEACKNSGLDNVRFAGFQTGESLRELIRHAAFSVYFSVWYENAPLSVLESQALGTPVLCNRIGGIPELVEEGGTGILNDVFTPEGYREKIRQLYEDKELRRTLSRRCLEKRTSVMTLESYVPYLLNVYAHAGKRRGELLEKNYVFTVQSGEGRRGENLSGYRQ